MQSTEFLDLFSSKDGDEVVIWKDSSAIGFSVLRNYPENTKFHVAKKQKNSIPDTVAMIKVGYMLADIKEDGTVGLKLNISKASRFLLDGNFKFDFKNPDSPNEAELKASDSSLQPINLEDNSRFILNTANRKFFDSELGKNVTLREIVDFEYDLHLQTLKFVGKYLRFRMKVNSGLVLVDEKLITLATWFAKWYFDKPVNEEAKKAKLGLGIYKTYELNDFGQEGSSGNLPIVVSGSELDDDTVSIPGINWKISKMAAFLASLLLFSIFYRNYFGLGDWGMGALLKSNNSYYIFNIVVLIVLYQIMDLIWKLFRTIFLPLFKIANGEFIFKHFVVPVINLLIVRRWKLMSKNFKFDPWFRVSKTKRKIRMMLLSLFKLPAISN